MRLLPRGRRAHLQGAVLAGSVARLRSLNDHNGAAAVSVTERQHSIFLDEVWLTPLQIARQFGYATDKPVRKAIMRGELRATRAPCGRKLVVAETEVLRWIKSALAFEPRFAGSERSTESVHTPARGGRRSSVPRLHYDARRAPSG